MRKWSYITAAFLLGVVVTLSSGEAYAQVKSLIGKKVSGEVTVVVDGKTLTEKGAIIDGVTNVPARALSGALGAEINLEGKSVVITSEQPTDKVVLLEGKYYTKYDLLNKKTDIENSINKIPEQEEQYKKRYEELMQSGMTETAEKFREADKKQIDDRKQYLNGELQRINEALKQFD